MNDATTHDEDADDRVTDRRTPATRAVLQSAPAGDPQPLARVSLPSAISAALVTLAIGFALPRVWSRLEVFDVEEGHRQPIETMEDYWQYRRWTGRILDDGGIAVLGDSVVWGEFARPQETLSAELDRRFPDASFANAGLKGLHPLALEGLVADVMRTRRGAGVVIHFNPVWLTSLDRDLAVANVPFNHATLVPSWLHRVPADDAGLETRLGRWMRRHLEPWSWAQHVRLEYYDGLDLQRWCLAHPASLPWAPIDLRVDRPEDAASSRIPIRRRIVPVVYDWVPLESSLQWAAFRRALTRLQRRGVPLFVLVGQLHPAMLEAEGGAAQARMLDQVEHWLAEAGIPFHRLPSPAESMADASHPTPQGYRLQAENLAGTPEFADWVRSVAPGGARRGFP